MASFSVDSPELELYQSQIQKPSPLRIIKRSKTISGSSTSNKSLSGWRRSSSTSAQSTSSVPHAEDRPLPIRKLRKGRENFWSHLPEAPGSYANRTTNLGAPAISRGPSEDHDITPKLSQDTRTTSVGAFLEVEYHENEEGLGGGFNSMRVPRRSLNVAKRPSLVHQHEHVFHELAHNTSPSLPIRRVSKSKHFLLRAIPGRFDTPEVKRSDSSTSKSTLVRRMSRRRDSSCGSFASSHDASEASIDTKSLFRPASLDISSCNSKTPTLHHPNNPHSQDFPSTGVYPWLRQHFQENLVLYPHILVTPEVATIDAAASIIWVAITVSGSLQIATGHTNQRMDTANFVQPTSFPTGATHGTLHSMRIDLHPGQGCTILEIVGNLHESKTLSPGDTQLILAKIRLGKVELMAGQEEQSAEDMIADLENHLGDTLSSYLTVRLTYKHSGFPNNKLMDANDGMKLRMTRINTEATATIKRRNLDSAWSPRTSRTMSNPITTSPVIALVEQHLVPEKALEIKKKLIDSRSPVSIARKFGYWSETPRLASVESGNKEVVNIESALYDSPRTSLSNGTGKISSIRQSLGSATLRGDKNFVLDQFETIDPARKIWSEMRMTSKGGRHRQERGSISVNHYLSPEAENDAGGDIHADSTTSKRQKSKSTGTFDLQDVISVERSRIMDAALKNKRSVGAETLRSIAPSVSKADQTATRGPAPSTAPVVGRAWGWTPAWW